MPDETHVLMDGALHVYRRENSRFWQCSTYLGSRNHRQTTKEVNLAAAKDFARDWYMERCVEDRQRRRGAAVLQDGPVQLHAAGSGASSDGRRRRTPTGPSFGDAADAFVSEFEVITLGERNADYVKQKSDHIRVHLLRSSAKPRWRTSRPERFRNIGRIGRPPGSIPKPESPRSLPVRLCMARLSRFVRC